MPDSWSDGQTGGRPNDEAISPVTLSVAKGPELSFIPRVLGVIRSILGMPDYERHITHLREHHPERTIPTERQFYEEFVRARYVDGPTRCC